MRANETYVLRARVRLDGVFMNTGLETMVVLFWPKFTTKVLMTAA